jgi:N-acetylmuramoyl-L-alanine amidase
MKNFAGSGRALDPIVSKVPEYGWWGQAVTRVGICLDACGPIRRRRGNFGFPNDPAACYGSAMNFACRPLCLALLSFACLQCRPVGPPGGGRDSYRSRSQVSRQGAGRVSLSQMLRQVNLKVDMVRAGTYGRKVVRPMRPRYITIHATENYTADAARHSLALKRGALRSAKTRYGNRIGFLIWHYTVDDHQAIQHMPCSEQGEHADFHGPGNCQSIGIEMCENRGSSRQATMDRTAKLAAVLMKRYNIPISNVVPHYHWPRRGKHPANKPCPHFLMDHGRPGPKWRAFQAKVNRYYRELDG